MKDEKQIEEMAKILNPNSCFDEGISACRKTEDCDICHATKLYNAGYRKQAEGEWISVEPSIGLYACSLCDHRILRAKCNYCPNCGAKMKGGEEK